MPTFEILDANEAALQIPDNRIFVPAAFKDGRFRVLTPVQRIVLGLSYLGETNLTDEEVGQLLEPPKSASTVGRIKSEAIWRLDYFDQIKTFQIDPLHLSRRAMNAVLGNFGDISLDELTQKVYDEGEDLLCHTRRFGRKTLQEIREKLEPFLIVI